MTANALPPRTLPTDNEFFLVKATDLMERSTTLESTSTRPSARRLSAHPVVERIGDGLAERRFRRHLVTQFGELGLLFSHDRRCLATPHYEPGIETFTAQFRLDAIDLGNPCEDRQSLRRTGQLDDLDELPPGVGKAEGQPHWRDVALFPDA